MAAPYAAPKPSVHNEVPGMRRVMELAVFAAVCLTVVACGGDSPGEVADVVAEEPSVLVPLASSGNVESASYRASFALGVNTVAGESPQAAGADDE